MKQWEYRNDDWKYFMLSEKKEGLSHYLSICVFLFWTFMFLTKQDHK